MKKLSFLMVGAAALLMASCSQDDAPNKHAGQSTYSVKVKVPQEIGTRALNDGLKATQLSVLVFDANTNAYVTTAEAVFPDDALETTVNFELALNKSYKMFYFAQSPEAKEEGVYNLSSTDATVTVNYGAMTSDNNIADAYDCFYRLELTPTITQDTPSTTVVLTRFMSQVNWGTNDYLKDAIANEGAFGEGGQYIRTNFTGQAFSKWFMLDEMVDESSTVNVAFNNFKAPLGESFPVAGDPAYEYVAMQYLLASKDTPFEMDATLTINNSGNQNENAAIGNYVVEVNNVPIEMNFRTNIYGTLLSTDYSVNVVKWPNFWNPDFDITYPQEEEGD